MPTAEEILASLNLEDGGDGEHDNEDSPDSQQNKDNSAIRAARKAARDWESKAKALAQENADLLAFKAQVETGQKAGSAKEVLASLGLNEKQASKQAELFTRIHEGEVTPEAVKQFAVDYGLVEEGAEEDEGGTPPAPTPHRGFEPGGTGGTPPAGGPNLMPRDEWESLYFRDKDAAMKVAQAGKVDMSGTSL